MPPKLKAAFKKEMAKAIELYNEASYKKCFFHLERAHILGQRHYLPHVHSHWWMLKVGWKESDLGEIFGQITRIIASAGSFLGWVPLGNTGGANVSPIVPMPIPKDLEHLLQDEPQPSFAQLLLRIGLIGLAVYSVLLLTA